MSSPRHYSVANDTRSLPRLTDDNRHFWTGGANGQLVLQRCGDCGFWIHPAGPICPRCHSRNRAPAATGGTGRIYSFTVNHQRWTPAWEVPYVIAIIELDDQEGLRVTSNIDTPIAEVAIGLEVEVCFEHVADVWLPYFVPARQS